MRKSFTLIELIVVIGIIALLSGIGVSSYNGFQMAARDSRRKADLETITNALNAYYAVHGRFPQAGACNYGQNCYVYSDSGSSWIPALVTEKFIEELPVDPINKRACSTCSATNDIGPWSDTYSNYIYAYGNVHGQEYELTARLENTSDPDRCEVNNYKYSPSSPTTKNSWCKAYGGVFSNQIYEFSPNSR